MVNIVDDEVQALRKEVASLNFEIARVRAADECENLMDKYQYFHMRGMRTEETALFALKTPGVRVEMRWGIYDEPEGVMRWRKSEGHSKPRPKDVFPLHCMATPVIEVAKDGETVRGQWRMIGSETVTEPDGKTKAYWAAGRFAMDFVKEDGEWKIWKYNTTGLVMAPFEKGWIKANMTLPELEEQIEKAMKEKGDRKPDRRPSFPFTSSKGEQSEDIPPIPLPYETWDESLACVPEPGRKWVLVNKKFNESKKKAK
jgi:hypothetical protein